MPASEFASDGPVRRRHVFYISGFDPLGPSRYHQLYKDEAAKQQRINGMSIEVSARRKIDDVSVTWDVSAREGDVEVGTQFEFLRWDDIVRAQWPRSQWAQLRQTLFTTWRYAIEGSFVRIGRWHPAGVFVLILPTLLMAGLPLIAMVLALPLMWCPWPAAAWLGMAWMLAVIGGLSWIGLRATARMQLAWLMRSFAFTYRHVSGQVPEMEARLDEFGVRIARSVQTAKAEEVLVVGHSSGAMMAMMAVSRAAGHLMAVAQSGSGPRLSLLTLGHCTPMISSVPAAQRFRDDVSRLSNSRAWVWLDFTAPADGSCSPLVDPCLGCPGAAGATQGRPRLLSTRFATMFSSHGYAALLKDRMRYHFQYLMASELPGRYDYFAITAGSLGLEHRFRDVPSASRDQLAGRWWWNRWAFWRR